MSTPVLTSLGLPIVTNQLTLGPVSQNQVHTPQSIPTVNPVNIAPVSGAVSGAPQPIPAYNSQCYYPPPENNQRPIVPYNLGSYQPFQPALTNIPIPGVGNKLPSDLEILEAELDANGLGKGFDVKSLFVSEDVKLKVQFLLLKVRHLATLSARKDQTIADKDQIIQSKSETIETLRNTCDEYHYYD